MKGNILERIKKALGIRSPSAIHSNKIPQEKEEPPQNEPCGGTMERTNVPMTYKLGSLFDGSGGFPLAGSLCGIVPVWAAEVEPYPIAVTRSRFPGMRHLGDISKVNGAEIEPVDIITFGSPCQDLSVAGKRAGLKHADNGDEETTRSGLFMEAVRIIKEMREATNGNYPRFALWENVPGAFSSNKGEDFKIVCEELIKIIEPAAAMPAVPKNGWPYADSYTGDGWSLAYRVFDAQYWGVPQRRRRIHLVVDFTGQCARNVLFEREGVRGYFTEGGTPWKAAASNANKGVGATDTEGTVPYTLKIRSGCEGGGKGALVQTNKSATIKTTNDQYLFQPIIDRHILDDQGGQQITVRTDGKSPTLRAEMHGNIPCVMQAAGFKDRAGAKAGSLGYQEELAPTLLAGMMPSVVYDARGNGDGTVAPCLTGDHNNRITDYTSVVVECSPTYSIQGNTIDRNAQQNGSGICENVSHTLNAVDRHGVSYGTDVGFFNSIENKSPTLLARTYKDPHLVTFPADKIHYIVRRMTPTECARLQGFADEWGHIDQKESLTPEEKVFWMEVRNTKAAIDGKEVKEYTEKQMLTWYNKLHTDSSEYKMWGNGIALPPALYCMQGIMDALVAVK